MFYICVTSLESFAAFRKKTKQVILLRRGQLSLNAVTHHQKIIIEAFHDILLSNVYNFSCSADGGSNESNRCHILYWEQQMFPGYFLPHHTTRTLTNDYSVTFRLMRIRKQIEILNLQWFEIPEKNLNRSYFYWVIASIRMSKSNAKNQVTE